MSPTFSLFQKKFHNFHFFHQMIPTFSISYKMSRYIRSRKTDSSRRSLRLEFFSSSTRESWGYFLKYAKIWGHNTINHSCFLLKWCCFISCIEEEKISTSYSSQMNQFSVTDFFCWTFYEKIWKLETFNEKTKSWEISWNMLKVGDIKLY